jgi:hypothetical protein
LAVLGRAGEQGLMRAAAEKADPVPVVLFHRDHDNDLEHNNDDGDNHVDLELAHCRRLMSRLRYLDSMGIVGARVYALR